MGKLGSTWSKGRRCFGCKHFISTRKEKTEYAGRCGKYEVLVKDSLCGCREGEKPGSVVLMNFGDNATQRRDHIG